MSIISNKSINDLKFLRDAVLNGTASIEGCLLQARKYLRGIETAIKLYSEDVKKEVKKDE